MSSERHPILEFLRHDPAQAFARVRRARTMPAIHSPSITRVHGRLSHVGRVEQPALAFVGRVESANEAIRAWALLVDVLPRGPLDLECVWHWPWMHATLRHEFGVPTLHMLFVEPEQVSDLHAAFGAEPELLPILVHSLDADADRLALRARAAS
ncbi:hypothetical protein ACNOYE_17125 [Nannocystaceae bacterium ST9]